MKKNPLSEIYESKILTTEAVASDKVKGASELEAKFDAKKATTVKGQGPEACAKDLKKPEEAEGTDVKAATPKVLKDSVEAEQPKKAFEGSFERLFKATINEQYPGEDEVGAVELGVDVPTSDEEMVDELEGEKDEVSDLVSDLKSVMDHLQNILDKISDETSGSEEQSEEEIEFGSEESENEENDIEELKDSVQVEEASELKPLGDKSKVLQNKNNKVGGTIKVHGGKAHSGDVESDPELKPAKSFDKSLQSPKGKPEVKSAIKKGEFFK